MTIRLAADLQPDSIVDGEGIRTVIWTQGCSHHCFGCHNPQTHDFKGGEEVELNDLYHAIDELEGQDGITFSGGDPFYQPKECFEIAKYARKKGLNIWSYSGFTFEELLELSKKDKNIYNFLNEIDVLVDGRFILSKKSYNCIFRGSTNQRIIDVKKSLKEKKAILMDKYKDKEVYSNRIRQDGVFI